MHASFYQNIQTIGSYAEVSDKQKNVLAILSPENCSSKCCEYSDSSEPYSLVTTMEAVNSGWIATGEFNLKGKMGTDNKPLYEVVCVNCGKLYNAISKLVPIEIQSYPCPSCNSSDDMKLNILSVNKKEDLQFEFKAEYFCKSCKLKNRFKQMFNWTKMIKKIEIKATGIIFEQK